MENLTHMNLEKLKFPIGTFEKPEVITKEILTEWISDISTFPERLMKEVLHLSEQKLDTPYRPEGWTIRQVVHHCADSHMNSFTRLKLTLTEDRPIVKPYFEERWAELSDSKSFPIHSSLKMLEGIHERWSFLLNNLTELDLERIYIHPEHGAQFRIDEYIGLYAWHCNHHLAHITSLKF
jgi:hypothetical protein